MRNRMWLAATAVVAAGSFALGAETRKTFVDTYAAIADTILGSKKAESGIVKAILENHANAARRAFDQGKWEESAAEMALFANEGDNQIGGIRKRLLEGGHHHNAEGEAKGIYEEGYVLVTKEAKRKAREASAQLLAAKNDAERKAAWDMFAGSADPICK